MIRDKAVDIIMGRLGNRNNAILQQSVIDEMVFVQENLLEGHIELFWFLLSESASDSTIPLETRVIVPSDFLGEWEDGGLYIAEDDGTETLLIREDWDIILSQVQLEGTGKPTYYDLMGDYYFLRKVPDKVYTIRQRYYQKALSLNGVYGDANNIENVWLKYASDWLIAETGLIVAAQRMQADKLSQMFMVQATKARERLEKKNISFQESNKLRHMGD